MMRAVCEYGDWNVWLHEYRNYCGVFTDFYDVVNDLKVTDSLTVLVFVV